MEQIHNGLGQQRQLIEVAEDYEVKQFGPTSKKPSQIHFASP